MQENGIKNPNASLVDLGINAAIANWNLSSAALTAKTLELNQGVLNDLDALCVNTGKFTGRSPKDKFTVKDAITENTVDWGDVNIPFDAQAFDALYTKVCNYLSGKELWVRDAYACADPAFRLNIRVINETPWANLFCNDLFLRPTAEEIQSQNPDWIIVQAPSFQADPAVDGTRQANFTIVNFTRKIILIGGSGYTGEMKKGIFGVLNFVLPHEHSVLSMHCSANEGKDGDVALFFGLSGTGKTTLSADPNRALIGDDEHGWAKGSVFNFEGGCYAKCIDLSAEKEPQIYKAIKPGALLENIVFNEGTNSVNFADGSITENTRVAYPIDHIDNAKTPSYGGNPKNIFFLTCDAFGILPPISKLTTEQAMYHFISGYTAKVAGTEAGVLEPQPSFSACFGAPFMPLHPAKYAEMLSKKMKEAGVNVWLVNTGWTGGPYGIGTRMKLKYTRAMINAVLNGDLGLYTYDNYHIHSVFGVAQPRECPGVPTSVLSPRATWNNDEAYYKTAFKLTNAFRENFKKYEAFASEEIRRGGPQRYAF